MLLKAGTYRFNDVPDLSQYDTSTVRYNLPFTVNSSQGFVGECDTMAISIENIAYNVINITPTQDVFSLPVELPAYSRGITSVGVGWGLAYFGLSGQEITITKDTEVDDTFGTWYIANTNYNEVNPTEDVEYIEVASWYTRVANAIRSKKGTSEPILRDNFASEIESISVGADIPEYDGTVVIEKAESVLGLRRFKETLTENPRLVFDMEFTFNAIHSMLGEVAGHCSQINTLALDGGVAYIVDSTTPDVSQYGISLPWTMFVYSPNGWDTDRYGDGIKTINVISCEDENAIAWLLANTEGVSV